MKQAGLNRHMRYAIVIERANKNYSAYVPDLPGCVSTGVSVDEVKRNIAEAIEFHLDGLREDGLPIPSPTTVLDYVDTAA
jgi:predicted RNase H-like HicB family nuclease